MNLTLERARSPTYPTLSPLAQDVLRVTAITSMVMDHVNRVFFSEGILVFTLAGRLAFPLFALLIAHNIHDRGVSWRRYVLPLLIAGVAAQLPFMKLFAPQLNIMFTLLLGVLIEPGARFLERKFAKGSGPYIWALAALPNLVMDYPLLGVWVVPVAGFLVERGQWWHWVALLGLSLFTNQFSPQTFTVLLLPILVWGAAMLEGERLTVPRWFWYGFYPLHLFILAVLERA
jgi:TraX protein